MGITQKRWTMINLQNVYKRYDKHIVLNNINLKIEAGEYISFIGKSGSGKSTLLNIIGTIDFDYEGKYIFNKIMLKKNTIPKGLRGEKIGYIFQQYNLIPNISVYDNIILPFFYSNKDIDSLQDKIDTELIYFDLMDKKNQKTSTLSGGEQQRVTIIRSIIMNPDVIIADEPTGNLDKSNAEIVEKFLQNENLKGKTIILVTHNKQLAMQAQKTFMIEKGDLIQIGEN